MGNLIFITGMSGAGKSRAINALEDMDFYCVDNLPAALTATFADLVAQSQNKLSNVAIVIDSRGGESFSSELKNALQELSDKKISYKVLFLEASAEVIVHRYRETRRRHPLRSTTGGDVAKAVETERRLLMPIRGMADYIIDTTNLTPAQLRERIVGMFSDREHTGMIINCISFGFKYGLPGDADLVFDLRCLPNPFYVDELKHLNGKDKPVRDYIFKYDSANEFLERITGMLDFSLPLYAEEGKSQLVIALGCTGGRHRSVAFAEAVAEHLRGKVGSVGIMHRDILK